MPYRRISNVDRLKNTLIDFNFIDHRTITYLEKFPFQLGYVDLRLVTPRIDDNDA